MSASSGLGSCSLELLPAARVTASCQVQDPDDIDNVERTKKTKDGKWNCTVPASLREVKSS